jgi:hypothetical protein
MQPSVPKRLRLASSNYAPAGVSAATALAKAPVRAIFDSIATEDEEIELSQLTDVEEKKQAHIYLDIPQSHERTVEKAQCVTLAQFPANFDNIATEDEEIQLSQLTDVEERKQAHIDLDTPQRHEGTVEISPPRLVKIPTKKMVPGLETAALSPQIHFDRTVPKEGNEILPQQTDERDQPEREEKLQSVPCSALNVFNVVPSLLNILGHLPPTVCSFKLAAVAKPFAVQLLSNYQNIRIFGQTRPYDELRFWRLYGQMRVFEQKECKEREQRIKQSQSHGASSSIFKLAASAQAGEVGKDIEWPMQSLVGMPLDVFEFIFPKEVVSEFSAESGRCMSDQSKPTPVGTVAVTYDRILLLLSPSSSIRNFLHGGPECARFPWHEMKQNSWCCGTVQTALHILQKHDVNPEENFWSVVATMLLISTSAEEMVPILKWACRVSMGYHARLGAQHELPCFLYLHLCGPSSSNDSVRSTTAGLRSELARLINFLSHQDFYRGSRGRTPETRSCRAQGLPAGVATDAATSLATATAAASRFYPRGPTSSSSKRECMPELLRKIRKKFSFEQCQVIEYASQSGTVVNVTAYAGTGKTTTALEQQAFNFKLSESFGQKYLMLFFNKAASEDAKKRIGSQGLESHVEAKTMDSLIYNLVYGGGRSKGMKSVNADLVKKMIPDILPRAPPRSRAMPGRILPLASSGTSEVLKKFLSSDGVTFDTLEIRKVAARLNKDWTSKTLNARGTRPADYATPVPNWIELAQAVLRKMATSSFLRKYTCCELLTKLTQLKTRACMEEGIVEQQNTESQLMFKDLDLLDNPEIKPLNISDGGYRQLIIDEGWWLFSVLRTMEVLNSKAFLQSPSRSLSLSRSARFESVPVRSLCPSTKTRTRRCRGSFQF